MLAIEKDACVPGAIKMSKTGAWLATIAVASGLGIGAVSTTYAASELSDEPKPLLTEDELPRRTAPLIEIGPDFLGTGNLPKGWVLPTGAVWQPSLWVFGSSRTSYNFVENRNSGEDLSELATRLDLFANVQLTGTERFLLGVSPLRRSGGFTNYQFSPSEGEGYNEHVTLKPTTAFFEGEFGEIFPGLDPRDQGAYDVSFSIGRQPIFFQEGALVNDTIDSIGINRDTIMVPNLVIDWRMTFLIGLNDVHRADRQRHGDDVLLGWFNELNFRERTVNFDAVTVTNSDHRGFYGGVGMVQRFGHWNVALRLNGSKALDEESAIVSDGLLGFAEVSRTLPYGEDLVYANAFGVAGTFTPAALGPDAGSPLGRAGILFASSELGRFGAALSGATEDTYGGAIGIQKFFNNARTQLILEAGGRYDGGDDIGNSAALGAQVQHAIGRRVVVRADAFYAVQEGSGGNGFGARAEIAINF